jgi:DNA-binding SARP family transcriptional activator
MRTVASRDRSAPDVVRVWLLGGFRVSVGDRKGDASTWRLRKAASLIKLLALAPGHRLQRDRAMDLLWPESGRKSASNNLRQILHATRRTLIPDPTQGSRYLASEDESLVLCPEGDLWVDVDAFEEAAAIARRAREPGAYRAAIELYAGELLPEDRYEEWTEERRETLRQTRLRLLVELARLHEERGEIGPAIETLGEAVTHEPTDEQAHASLMRLYALSGREAEALLQYGRLEEVLARDLGAEPAASSRVLREEIASGRLVSKGREEDERTLSETPTGIGLHNLPAPRSSFVGREQEMLELKRALAMTRLLTLTGVGGSGKTRLGLEVARDLPSSTNIPRFSCACGNRVRLSGPRPPAHGSSRQHPTLHPPCSKGTWR